MSSRSEEVPATLLGVPLVVPLMNAPGTVETGPEVEALVAAGPGAVCLRPVTVQPFVHPQFRALRNPGHDRLLPLVRQLAELGTVPIVATIAGSTPAELGFLARVFGEAGASLLQLALSDPWVGATLAPFEDLATLAETCLAVREHAATPVLCEVPSEARRRYGEIAHVLRESGIGGVVVSADFTGFEKFVLEAGRGTLEVVACGDLAFGWDVGRAIDKGARAVQLDQPIRREGPRAVTRIVRELRGRRR